MARRILVVEDSPTQAERLRLLLEDQGYQVEVARNGREGLAAAKSGPPDLIVSDVVMPEMDGFAFCQAVKAEDVTKRIPFVLLTGQRTPMDIIHGLQKGADNFITKPFEDDYLVDRVRRIFDNLAHRERGGLEMEVAVRLSGREIVVNADKQQMIELLFSTSEELSESHKHLEAARLQLEEQARDLERKVQERTQELRQAEEKFRTLVEQMPAVVYTAAHERVGQARYMSPQIETLLGFPTADWLTDPDHWTHRIHPDDRERVTAVFGGLRATGTPASAEYRLVARDGRQTWVRDMARVVRSAEGTAPFVQGVILDISDRKRAEEALRASESSFRLLFASNPHPMWVFDGEGSRFLEVNEAAVAHYGYSRDEFLAKTIRDLHPSDNIPIVEQHFQEALREPGQEAFRSPRVWKHRKKDGTLIDVEIAVSPIEFLGRKAWLALANDITEKKRLEAQLLQAQKMESVGRLAGGVAHDFNNLLGVITGYGELLEKSLPDEARPQKYIKDIMRAAERAAGLTRQLLAFSRRQVLQPRILDLNTVVGEMEKMLRRLIGEDIQLITVLDESLGRVQADPGQIEQVLMNLAVNARDAMPRGGRLTIETANVDLDAAYARSRPGVKPGPHVMLAVSDTGHGMDQEVLAQVFEPFFTTKEAGKGTGLGLATVHGIVSQSAGHIFVYSEPEHGTTFKVYLPRTQEAETVVKAAPAKAEPERGSETILLVEDEESLRSLVRECLEASGYTVVEARHPGHALEIAQAHAVHIHLLITDVVMPGMSGSELAARLVGSHREMKVLYMSGYTDDAVVLHGVLAANAAFLQKPFTMEALARKVREVLGGSG
ncbi:MAG TPA: response regulator [Vicinamibacteria bacterium]|nr:response regulator [Vicinamibacteria bacterium]